MKLKFNDVEIDSELYELRRHGELVHVEPKVFNMITFLAKNPNVVFSTDELINTIWHGRTVSDATVATCVANARKALGDSGSTQTIIKTVRGRGFRFVAKVTTNKSETKDASPVPESTEQLIQLPISHEPPVSDFVHKSIPVSPVEEQSDPSLLIFPFQVLSSDTDSTAAASFAQTLTSTLEIVLLRIPLLQLTSYSFLPVNSANPAISSRLNREYGIDYILEGSVQANQNKVTLNVSLSDASQGKKLWAEQFVLQGNYQSTLEKSVSALTGKLEPQLHRAMYNRARSANSTGGSRALYLQASGILALKGWHHDSFSSASTLLRESWQQDPEFAQAAAYLSVVLGLGSRLDLLKKHKDLLREAEDAANAAIQLDDMDSSVLGLAGCALADLGFSERGLRIIRNAVDLNPSNAQARSALGGVCLTTRQVNSAIDHLKHGIKMSPLDSRLSVWGGLLSSALRIKGDLEGAVTEAQKACQYDHRAYMPQVILSGACVANDNPESAKLALDEAYRIKPDLTSGQIHSLCGRRLGNEVLSLR